MQILLIVVISIIVVIVIFASYRLKKVKKEVNQVGKFEDLGIRIGKLTDEKDKAYGSAVSCAGPFLKLLWPDGCPPEQFEDMLIIVRMFDKMKRIATNKDAFSESPFQDLAGYALLGLEHSEAKKNKE